MDKANSQYYRILPSTSVYAEALSQLMARVKWTRIAVVLTQAPNSYSFEMAKVVMRMLQDKGFEPVVTVQISDDEIAAHEEYFLMNAIRQLHTSGAKIIYVLLPPLQTTQLICRAYNYGLRWPVYGWIIPDESLEDTLNVSNSGNCEPNAAEGIFSIKLNVTNGANISKSEAVSSYDICLRARPTIAEELHSNIYATALYDSIQATALSLNQTFYKIQEYLDISMSNSLTRHKLEIQKRVSQSIGHNFVNISFVGSLGKISLNRSELTTETHIALFQNINGSLLKLALYNPLTNKTEFENYSASRIPRDTLSTEYNLLPLPMGVLLMTGLVLCTLLTLLNMSLYIYYRKTPEMKATSVGLSISQLLRNLYWLWD